LKRNPDFLVSALRLVVLQRSNFGPDSLLAHLTCLVEGARRAADAGAVAVALLLQLILLLLDDPAAAVTGSPNFRCCAGLQSPSLLLELPSFNEEERPSIVFFCCLS
jgi:hypothetical protein